MDQQRPFNIFANKIFPRQKLTIGTQPSVFTVPTLYLASLTSKTKSDAVQASDPGGMGCWLSA